MTKRFTIEFTDNDQTRWLCSDSNLAELLDRMGRIMAAAHTSGPIPVVAVTQDREAFTHNPDPTRP